MDELFSAAARIGELWSASPVVEAFVAERKAALTDDEGRPNKPYQHALQMFLTSGSFNTQPLLTGWWLSAMAQGQAVSKMHDAKPFLDSAGRTASAFLLLIEWLRSWLPGYPFAFRLPHLDPHASRVIGRGLPNQLLPWSMELRRASLHSLGAIDDQLAPVIEIDRALLAGPLLYLRRQLWVSSAWQEFKAAHGTLDDDARRRLTALVDQFRSDCRMFDQSASERLMIDDAARRAAVDRCEQAALSDAPLARYYKAFRGIDRLIESVGALITQFALRERVETVQPTQVTWKRGDDPEVRFTLVNESPWFRVNQLVHIASPIAALQCLAQIEGTTVSFDNLLGELARHVASIAAIGTDATPDVRAHTGEGQFLNGMRRA